MWMFNKNAVQKHVDNKVKISSGYVAAYMRVSTDRQDEAMQRDKIMEILPKDKAVIWYIDHGITGTKDMYTNREQYAKMLSDADAGKLERIYCYDWSRMWRNVAEQARAMAQFMAAGVPLTSHTEGNYDREEDNFIMYVHGAMNEEEARKTRRKVIGGIATKQKETAEAMADAIRSGRNYEDIPKKQRWGNRWENSEGKGNSS